MHIYNEVRESKGQPDCLDLQEHYFTKDEIDGAINSLES